MTWRQTTLRLSAKNRGFHLITREIVEGMPDLRSCKIGLLHVFICHTSASLTVNENADPDVRFDMETAFGALVPEQGFPFRHTAEGPDDMPAHVKASMLGSSVTIPVRDGRLALGTWQGVYLGEHRDDGSTRELVLTLSGELS